MVSYIIPVYNAEKTIERCLLSVIKQTFQDIEILVVNDGSTDNTLDIVSDIALSDKRIRIITIENRGVSGARNTGLMYTKGEYVQFLDGDDYVHANLTQYLYESIVEGGCDLAGCGYYGVEKGKIVYKSGLNRVYNSRNEWKKEMPVLYECGFLNTVWNKLYKRELIKENFSEKYSFGEDMLFNLLYISKIDKIVISDEALHFYSVPDNRVHLSNRYNKSHLEAVFTNYMEIKNIIDDDCTYIQEFAWHYRREIFRLLIKSVICNTKKQEFEKCIEAINTQTKKLFEEKINSNKLHIDICWELLEKNQVGCLRVYLTLCIIPRRMYMFVKRIFKIWG